MPWTLRLATLADVPTLEALIPLSARRLLASHYSDAQIEAALGPVFGVDRQLIRDGTFFVVEADGQIVGCGGWSKRRSLFGGDKDSVEVVELDPRQDAARIRAFFVHPAWVRRGLGRELVRASEIAIRKAGFQKVELVATLAGEPLYAASGYQVTERYEIMLRSGVKLAAVKMSKRFTWPE